MRLATLIACLCVAIIGAVAVLAGCAGNDGSDGPPSPERALVAQLVVRQATLRFIEAAPVPAVRAAAVSAVVGRVLEYAEGNPDTSLAALEAAARALVPWDDLPLADRDLLDVLITVISQRLAERIDEGALDPEDRIAVAQVLRWVQAAATLQRGAA